MLRHLILLLFLTGLSLPSVAAPAQAETVATSCHDTMPTGGARDQRGGDDGGTAQHICIGCVTRLADNLLASSLPLPALLPPALPMATLAGASARPSIPPPRP